MSVDLLATKYGYFNSSLQSELYKALECIGTSRTLEEPIDLNTDPLLFEKMSWCYFPGASVFKMTRSLETTQKEVSEFLAKAQVKKFFLHRSGLLLSRMREPALKTELFFSGSRGLVDGLQSPP